VGDWHDRRDPGRERRRPLAADLAKVATERLRRRVIERVPERISVIVEVATSRPSVEMEKSDLTRRGGWKPKRVAPSPEADRDPQALTEVRDFLRDLLHEDPVWLASSNAFVVDAKGDEISEITRFPLVRAIYPNRRLA
jgi:hypothetical protein